MSMYMSFFVKSYTGDLMPIGTFCRGSGVYNMFCDYSEYGHVKPLTKNLLTEIQIDSKEELEHYNKIITKHEESLAFLQSAVMDVQEKMEVFNEIKDTIKDINEAMDEMRDAQKFGFFLKDMIDDMYDRFRYGAEPSIDPDEYVYFGIEIPWNTKVEVNEA